MSLQSFSDFRLNDIPSCLSENRPESISEFNPFLLERDPIVWTKMDSRTLNIFIQFVILSNILKQGNKVHATFE